MRKTAWNTDWQYRKLNSDEVFTAITLPYDCMLHEKRSDDSEGGCNNAWFEGHDYEFIKEFDYKAAGSGKNVLVEFEGIYHKAEIYCNGVLVASRPNGYLGLIADITSNLKMTGNVMRVIAHGSDIPNARWYTGAGVYRPVYLHEADGQYILPESLHIRTISTDPTVIDVEVSTAGGIGDVKISVLYEDEEVAHGVYHCDGNTPVRIEIPNAHLWNTDNPALYLCRAMFGEDIAEEPFGIRIITCDAKHGFCLNGERVILRGACIHHDNGLLGSVSLPQVEERKVHLLRMAGYNAIRSAHNPCSKALLDACDRCGMLVMDEYEDSWYVHKTKFDYATYLQDWYQQDLRDMVRKDYNHPCVIMYSLGNEVSETAESKGVELFKTMKACLQSFDSTRPITCGINLGFNQAAAAGHSFFSDEKAIKNDFRNLGTESSNHRKWMFGPLLTKLNALMPGCDKATKGIFAASDVAGYNYGILRYRHDRRKYPDRVILGSETFCEDAQHFWRLAQKDPGIIGDFVWTGIDHLGEVGLGAWEYKDYAPTYIHTKGWLTSGSGRIDITGKPLPEAFYILASYGMLKKPVIAVVPPNHNGERHSPSGWKMTNAVSSWAWEGCEGLKAKVEVYSCGETVELYLNDKKIARKAHKRSRRVKFSIPYRHGVITAIAYDKNKMEIGRSSLHALEGETSIILEAEEQKIEKGMLCYIRMRLADTNGVTNVLQRQKIKVSVSGGTLVGLGHACPYNDEGYVSDACSTYFGEAMAIVRAETSGEMTVRAVCQLGQAETKVLVE